MKKIESFISRSGAKASQKLAMLLGILLLSGGAYSQLDSATVVLSYSTTPSFADSTVLADVMNVEVTAGDVDFVGEVVVTVYDSTTNFPWYKQKFTLQEFIDDGLKSGSTLTVPIEEIDLGNSWRIETIVRNFQGGNLPVIVTNH